MSESKSEFEFNKSDAVKLLKRVQLRTYIFRLGVKCDKLIYGGNITPEEERTANSVRFLCDYLMWEPTSKALIHKFESLRKRMDDLIRPRIGEGYLFKSREHRREPSAGEILDPTGDALAKATAVFKATIRAYIMANEDAPKTPPMIEPLQHNEKPRLYRAMGLVFFSDKAGSFDMGVVAHHQSIAVDAVAEQMLKEYPSGSAVNINRMDFVQELENLPPKCPKCDYLGCRCRKNEEAESN
jgi:hypothetical protein